MLDIFNRSYNEVWKTIVQQYEIPQTYKPKMNNAKYGEN